MKKLLKLLIRTVISSIGTYIILLAVWYLTKSVSVLLIGSLICLIAVQVVLRRGSDYTSIDLYIILGATAGAVAGAISIFTGLNVTVSAVFAGVLTALLAGTITTVSRDQPRKKKT